MSRKPPPRDPNAPKRNQSAYLLYQNAMRDTFKHQNPGMTFGQLSKYTSAMYAELNPDEKQVWVQNAENDKQRYLAELKEYQPAPGYDKKGDAIAGVLSSVYESRGRSGAQRDPKSPKRCLSAYLHYQNAMRDSFKTMFPAKTFGELSKYTSEQYKLLTEQEKAHWAAVATRDKERYTKEMERYVPPDGYDKNGVMIAMKQKGPRKYVRRDKDPNAPKRARGSYVFFTLDTRPRLLQEFPDMKFTDLGNVMGERWRRLDPESKKHYEALAKADLQRYQDEMDAFNASKVDEQAASYNKDLSQHVYDAGYYPSPAREHPPPSHMSPQQQLQQQRGEHDANHSYYYPNDYNGNHHQ